MLHLISDSSGTYLEDPLNTAGSELVCGLSRKFYSDSLKSKKVHCSREKYD